VGEGWELLIFENCMVGGGGFRLKEGYYKVGESILIGCL
jgi:hypothetical protein